jgi:hypothetical protein
MRVSAILMWSSEMSLFANTADFHPQDCDGSDFGRRRRSDSEGAIAMTIAKFRIALNSAGGAI